MAARYEPYGYKHVFIPSMLSLSLICAYPVLAREPFNPQFLENINGAGVADLSTFAANPNSQLPGTYRVDIYVNGTAIGQTQNIQFTNEVSGQNQKVLQPCLTVAQLEQFGVRIEGVPALAKYKPTECVPFTKIIDKSSAEFDFNQQRLNLSFPQASMNQSAQGYVSPARWDNGIPAVILDYQFSGSRQFNNGSGNDTSSGSSNYLNLRSGINAGAWRLRNYSTWQNGGNVNRWNSINTYLQRGIIALRSQLTVGDTSTSGEIFDSVSIRGIQMATDDNMYPDSQRGFAPMIRGIAQTNAQVTIRQGSNVVYQSYVSPGAFVISDLYPSSNSGDLDVTITEADGRIQHFVQPYAAVPIMQREGRIKYNIAAGEYRGGAGGTGIEPRFAQGTLAWGAGKGFTAYSGVLASSKYTAILAGIGQNLAHLGAISVDVTQASTRIGNGYANSNGQSYRFLYSKAFADSGTSLTLLGYRYSTSGFYTFEESVGLQATDTTIDRYHRRSQFQARVNQNLDDFGSLYASFSRQDYWNQSTQNLYQAGYNTNIAGINYGLAYSYSRTASLDQTDKIVSFSMSVPLERFLPRAWASYYMTTNRGATTNQAGVSGTLLEGNNLSYSVQQSYANRGVGNSGNASLSYNGTYANTNVGYNYSSGGSNSSQQVNYGVRGGVLVHQDGVTLSQSPGETIALVKAPGAGSTKVMNYNGVRTDWRGYAVVPYVTPYRETNIALDTTSMGDNVELIDNGSHVVPTAGAVIRAEYITRIGYRVLMTLTHQGTAVPFGASVTLLDDKSRDSLSAIVGDGGVTYLTGLPTSGRLKVQWGKGSGQSCIVNYQLPVEGKNTTSGLIKAQQSC